MEQQNKPTYTYSPESGYGVVDTAEAERTQLKTAVNCLCFALLLSVFLSAVSKPAVSFLFSLAAPVQLLSNGQIVAPLPLAHIISGIAYLMQIALPAWVLYKLLPMKPQVAPVGKTSCKSVLLVAPILVSLGVMGTMAANIIVGILSSFGLHFGWPTSQVSTPFELVCSLITLALLPAIAEEAVFRGVVYGSLKPFGTRFAMLGSAVMFALAHLSLIKFVNALFIGLLLGYLVYKTGSLALGMALHFVNNSLSILISYIEQTMGLNDALFMIFYAVVCLFGIVAAMIAAKNDKDAFAIQEQQVKSTLTTKVKTACTTSGFLMMVPVILIVMFNNGRIY